MAQIRLDWRRFESFLSLREAFRSRPCVYLQTDPDERILRVGESDDLWNRYLGGTAYALEAALHGSRNLFFACEAPSDATERKRLEATLIWVLQPLYNNHHKSLPPFPRADFVQGGQAPKGVEVQDAV